MLITNLFIALSSYNAGRGFPLITYGVNHESYSHPYAFGYQHNSIHAEWDLIRRFKRKFPIQRLSECELWNLRLTRKLELRNSKPCIRCTKLLEKSYVARIYYSTDEGIFKEV